MRESSICKDFLNINYKVYLMLKLIKGKTIKVERKY
jgi:hypothetical protein